jgi:hypothetical protein
VREIYQVVRNPQQAQMHYLRWRLERSIEVHLPLLTVLEADQSDKLGTALTARSRSSIRSTVTLI